METAYYILNSYLSFPHILSLLIVFIATLLIWHLIAKKSSTQSIFIALFVTYIFFILLITLIARTPAVTPDGELTRHIKLIPFWSWYEVIVNGDRGLAVEILLNILLFMPVGVGMRILGVGIKRVAIICCCFSLAIEVTQYFMCRGLMEWDDVFGNVCGAVIGYLGCGYVMRLVKKKRKEP